MPGLLLIALSDFPHILFSSDFFFHFQIIDKDTRWHLAWDCILSHFS